MADILSSTRDEETRKRNDAASYQMQQQIDELRRQLRELTSRQQWLEDLYKHTEGQVVQLQMAQERHAQDVSQTLQVRQIEDGRLKQQIAELAQRVEEPLKPIRDLRAQIGELIDARRQDRERTANDLRQFEGLQGQIRQLVAQIGMIADAQRQLRDQIQELDTVHGETRQEIQRMAEAQRLEEARLRRHGVELQEMVENLRNQFTEIAARNVRVEDVRRQLIEQIENIQGLLGERTEQEGRLNSTLQRLDKQVTENHVRIQEHAETIRAQFSSEVTDLRQVGDQRMDRYVNRFQQLEDRLRDLDQRLADLLPQFETMRRRDEELDTTIESLEERLLRDELVGLEAQLDAMRQRRSKKQAELAQKAMLVRNVREARPHVEPPPAPPSDEDPA